MYLKPMKMALLLPWRNRGFLRPRYGLVDDDELSQRGSTMFITCDGLRLRATRQELMLIDAVPTGAD
jgi:hypothetical protein